MLRSFAPHYRIIQLKTIDKTRKLPVFQCKPRFSSIVHIMLNSLEGSLLIYFWRQETKSAHEESML